MQKIYRKNKISSFGGMPKFLKLIVFGRISVKFCNFGQILLQWQWLRACPKQG
jgi:hypothetical protein